VRGIPDHMITSVATESKVRRCARVIGEMLEEIDGELIRGVSASEGEQVGRFNSKASERRSDDL
jgi:hypothetical protein